MVGPSNGTGPAGSLPVTATHLPAFEYETGPYGDGAPGPTTPADGLGEVPLLAPGDGLGTGTGGVDMAPNTWVCMVLSGTTWMSLESERRT
jgi:hypothetical protein